MSYPVEIMGLTWRGTPAIQQDSILINGEVFQQNLGISKLHFMTDAFCIAVADGVSNSPKAERASQVALQAVNSQWQVLRQPIKLMAVQKYVCKALADNPMTNSASTTIAVLQRLDETDEVKNQTVYIQHVGDSRIYQFSPHTGWECRTKDHTVMESLRDTSDIQEGKQYASIYGGLDKYLVADWLYDDLPRALPQRITVTKGDWIMICSDGVHDLVSCENWPPCDAEVPLADWLRELKSKVFQAGAWDNGSAIVARWV